MMLEYRRVWGRWTVTASIWHNGQHLCAVTSSVHRSYASRDAFMRVMGMRNRP